jgi:hypothetical protein
MQTCDLFGPALVAQSPSVWPYTNEFGVSASACIFHVRVRRLSCEEMLARYRYFVQLSPTPRP